VLSIAEEYLLADLKKLCEHTARGIITTANVARLLSAAEQYHAVSLRLACMHFVQKNMADCANNQVSHNCFERLVAIEYSVLVVQLCIEQSLRRAV
jgi:hypothetical protein